MIKIKYNIGDKYGKLTIVDSAPLSAKYRNKRMVHCRCDCGKEMDFPIYYLAHGIVTSCGCGNSEPRADIRGQRFGKLTALEPTGEIRHHSAVWKCKCDCGNICYATVDTLKRGDRTGCGCTKRQSELDNAAEARKNQPLVDNTNLSALSSRTIYSNNTSGYKGVSFHKPSGKWIARITIKGKAYALGSYDNIEDARKARLRAEEELVKPILEMHADKYPEFIKRFLKKIE